MIDFWKEAEDRKEEIVSYRETFHRDPELGKQEYHTSAFIEQVLIRNGYGIRHVGETGLVAFLEPEDVSREDNFFGEHSSRRAMPAACAYQPIGGADAGSDRRIAIAFRSDMDALPITEETGASFASQNKGVMHACGHDVHMASLLGCASILAAHRRELTRPVRLIFESDEEGDGGARAVCESGLLDDVGIVFGMHVSPDLPFGKIGVRPGRFYASAATFDVTVHGESTHGATPEKGTDALYAASLMCAQLKRLTGLYRGERAVVSVGSLHAGTARNVICGTADFSGIIRALGTDLRREVKGKFLETIRRVSSVCGVTCDIRLQDGYPGVVNEENATSYVKSRAEELFGAEHVVSVSEPTMTTEDFGCYLEGRRGSFYHLGVGGAFSLHSERFCPDSFAAVYGAALAAALLFPE